MKIISVATLTAGLVLMHVPASAASDAQFLESVQGHEGKGLVRLRTNRAPINVTCSFHSTATANSLSLDGKCRGLLVVSRSVSAQLTRNGSAYRGSNIGAGSGPASLAGKRRGNALQLTINWAKEINGDRRAQHSMQIKSFVNQNGTAALAFQKSWPLITHHAADETTFLAGRSLRSGYQDMSNWCSSHALMGIEPATLYSTILQLKGFEPETLQ